MNVSIKFIELFKISLRVSIKEYIFIMLTKCSQQHGNCSVRKVSGRGVPANPFEVSDIKLFSFSHERGVLKARPSHSILFSSGPFWGRDQGRRLLLAHLPFSVTGISNRRRPSYASNCMTKRELRLERRGELNIGCRGPRYAFMVTQGSATGVVYLWQNQGLQRIIKKVNV